MLGGALTQDGKLIGLALSAFSRARPGPEFADLQLPAAPPPDECEVVEVPTDDPFIPDIASAGRTGSCAAVFRSRPRARR